MATSEAATEGASHDDSFPTRARVADAILRGGPSTAARLAEELDLTPAAIRRHLDHLVVEGVLESRDQRVQGQRGRGRPAKVFALTDVGRGQFAHAYDEIAVDALQFLRDSIGEDAVKQFATHRLDDLRDRLADRLSEVEPAERPAALAEALSAEGFAASTSRTPAGTQMCQHHCPVAHVAEVVAYRRDALEPGGARYREEALSFDHARREQRRLQHPAVVQHGDAAFEAAEPARREAQGARRAGAIARKR